MLHLSAQTDRGKQEASVQTVFVEVVHIYINTGAGIICEMNRFRFIRLQTSGSFSPA